MFCQGCWDGFVDEECNVSSGTWKADVAESWHTNVDLSLEFDGDGASQGVGIWN